jgi:hypothetical protein
MLELFKIHAILLLRRRIFDQAVRTHPGGRSDTSVIKAVVVLAAPMPNVEGLPTVLTLAGPTVRLG